MSNNQIFLISFEYFPISQGGLARHAKAMIDRLLKYNGFQPTIAVPPDNTIRVNKNIITIPCIFFENKYLSYLEFSLRFFLKFKHRFNKDCFVLFSLLSYFLIPILPREFYLFVHSNEKRVFLTNYPGEGIKERLVRKTLYFFNYHWESYLCKKAKKIFSVSPSLKNETIYQYNISKDKIKIINNGLDTIVFKKQTSVKKPVKDLLFVGKISPRKNLIDLINIFRLLIDADPEFKLHIMGNGEKKYLNKIKSKVAKLKLSYKVFFYKYVSDIDLNKLYEKCGLFVTTSLVEGFGLVLLEAMSKSMPVIAYDNLGMRDIIIDKINGYIINPFDYRDFVDKILYLYKNKEAYEKMSENALKRVDDFSWDQSVKKLINELP